MHGLIFETSIWLLAGSTRLFTRISFSARWLTEWISTISILSLDVTQQCWERLLFNHSTTRLLTSSSHRDIFTIFNIVNMELYLLLYLHFHTTLFRLSTPLNHYHHIIWHMSEGLESIFQTHSHTLPFFWIFYFPSSNYYPTYIYNSTSGTNLDIGPGFWAFLDKFRRRGACWWARCTRHISLN